MPVEERPIHLRSGFDEVADDYQAVRPGYPPSLIKDVISLSAVPTEDASKAHILEIGCGTGQATVPFAQLGYQMTCLDIGPAMVSLAAQNCLPYPNVRIHLGDFEDWPGAPNIFDLVISATAFHWIRPEIGYPKAARVLKDSGALAIFFNEHPAQSDDFFSEVGEIYQRIVPEWGPRYTNQIIEAKIEEDIKSIVATIEATQLFEPVIVKTYPWAEDYTAATYVRLLNTYSNYRNLEADKRERLFREITTFIERRHGGIITKQYLAVLYFAKKMVNDSRTVDL
jgi:SAM-dependent methyltransferase